MGAAKRFTRNPGNEAIAYYRYSSDAQRDASIAEQRKGAQEYAAKHGLEIIKEYEDHAISGTRDDRPEFQRMLYEAGRLRPTHLILWKTDRLSRDKVDAAVAKGRLRNSGVEIRYVAESMPDDDEATRILLESLYEGLAASFIASHRKNVMRGLTYNAENCLYNGRKILGYKGKPDSKYEIDEKTAVLEDQMELLNKELEKARLKEKYQLTAEDIGRYFRLFVGRLDDKEQRNTLLDTLIDRIYVYDKEVMVTFTYTDEKRTLNIEEAEQLMEKRKNIMDLLNDRSKGSDMSFGETLEFLSLSLDDDAGKPPDFFGKGGRRQ